MEGKRGTLARIGLVLMSFVASGLGLLRLGQWRTAAAIYGITLAMMLFFNFAPIVPFSVLALVVIVALGTLIVAISLTWVRSRQRSNPIPWYSRWYSVTAAALLALAISAVLTRPGRTGYRNFYMPAESMAPTFPKNDRFIAYMGPSTGLNRGDLVLVRTTRGIIYVKRVAAIGGDRFAMRGGVVFLNGAAVPQHVIGKVLVPGIVGPESAEKLSEQFPGEPSSHEIYNLEQGFGDDFDETSIPANSVFLLGDHRDRSADSRYSEEESGLGGPVPLKSIVGRPVYQSWGSSRPMGTKLYH